MSYDCIFCKICNREIKTELVFENEKLVAFRDIHPQAEVHILIVPKKHVEDVSKIEDDSVFSEVFRAANTISAKLGIDKSGFRVVTNKGADATQTVFHVHFHLLGGQKLSGKMA